MDNSLKISTIAGLIGGIIVAIMVIITDTVARTLNIATIYWNIPTPPVTPLATIIANEFAINIIWGIALGVIYSKIYDLIPGKDVWKGLVYGLGIYLIYNIRNVTLALAYGFFTDVIYWSIGIFIWIAYGFVLGIIFKFLRDTYLTSKKELKISIYDVKRGIIPGAIAGIVDGIIISASFFVLAYAGIYEWVPGQLTDIEFMISHLGTHIVFNMLWWAIFGMLYARFYDVIPNKGIMKAVYFSMAVFFITSFRAGVYFLAYGYYIYAMQWVVIGFLAFAVSGPVLGYLYKKE